MHTKFGRNRLINKGDIIFCILHKNSIRPDPVTGFSGPCAIKKSGPLDSGNQPTYLDNSLLQNNKTTYWLHVNIASNISNPIY